MSLTDFSFLSILRRDHMNLGKEEKISLGVPPQSLPDEGDKEPKIVYPDFCVRDEAATKLLDEYECTLGEEIAATVRLRVSKLQSDEYGKCVGFEVIEIDDMAPETEEKEGEEAPEEEGDAEEEKALGYKRRKVVKEAPSVSAKDLE
jgi:hypothetical protein